MSFTEISIEVQYHTLTNHGSKGVVLALWMISRTLPSNGDHLDLDHLGLRYFPTVDFFKNSISVSENTDWPWPMVYLPPELNDQSLVDKVQELRSLEKFN